MTDWSPGVAPYQIVGAEIFMAWTTIVVLGLLARQFARSHRAAEFVIWFYLFGGIGTWAPSFLPAFWTNIGPSHVPDNSGAVLA